MESGLSWVKMRLGLENHRTIAQTVIAGSSTTAAMDVSPLSPEVPDDKLDEVEQPAVEAKHCPVDSFQVPTSCQVAHLNTKKHENGEHTLYMTQRVLS